MIAVARVTTYEKAMDTLYSANFNGLYRIVYDR